MLITDPQYLGPLAVWKHQPEKIGGLSGRVLLLHGIGEHSERHRNTVDYLLGQGIEVIRFDLRGSGKSEGQRQWIESFGDYLDDVDTVRQWCNREFPPKPLFLMGHSLGGAIAIHSVSRTGANTFCGLILSAPAYQLGRGVSRAKILVGRLLARFFPRLRIPGTLDLTALSRDPLIAEAYRNDPLCYRYNTLRQGDEILKALEQIPQACARITTPTLILHGSEDRLVLPKGSEAILRALAAKEKRLEIIPGGYHELYNDSDKEIFFTLVRNFIAKRLK